MDDDGDGDNDDDNGDDDDALGGENAATGNHAFKISSDRCRASERGVVKLVSEK